MMFVISLTYKKPLEEVERHIAEHIHFLDKYYLAKKFIVSGRKNPRTGGIILAHNLTLEEISEVLKEDPFHQHGIADYDITVFEPTMFDEQFKVFMPQ